MSKRAITWSNGKHTEETYRYKPVTGAGDTCATRAHFTKDYLVTEIGYVGSFGTTTKGMVGGVIRATVCVYKLTTDPNIVVVVNRGKFTI